MSCMTHEGKTILYQTVVGTKLGVTVSYTLQAKTYSAANGGGSDFYMINYVTIGLGTRTFAGRRYQWTSGLPPRCSVNM